MYLTTEELENLFDNGDPGYCTDCDDITRENGVEPDADGYECPACGHQSVMGLETAILLGHIQVNRTISDDLDDLDDLDGFDDFDENDSLMVSMDT